MEKIIIGKTEDTKSVLERIENSQTERVVLVIPRQSAFGEEVSHFETLREIASELSREIAIESVDENVLALARVNGFEAIHPLFEGKGKVSDILPAKAMRKRASAGGVKIHARKSKEPVFLREEEKVHKALHADVPESPESYEEKEEYKIPVEEAKFSGFGKILGALGILAVLLVVYFGGKAMFGRADIIIKFNKSPWQDTTGITASSVATKVISASGIIPAQIFVETKSATPFFPASGKSQVSERAKGKITIYNAYSSQAQPLVATTRFQTPDGKIFRLTDSVLVPRAKIQDGKIIPSTLVANIVADKAGSEYNVGPISRLSIPGFKGSPKFDAFYGSLDQPISGGFIGVKAVPTEADILSAKVKTTEMLKAFFDAGIFQGIPKEFTVVDGASALDITKLTANIATDDKGNFSIFGEAKFSAIGFREADLKELLLSKAEGIVANASFEKLEPFKYSNLKADFQNGKLQFTVDSEGVVTQAFDKDSFVSLILGKSDDEARSIISKIPELSQSNLFLRPFWLRSIPTEPGRVKIEVQ
ncbi:MAG: hypothetical protein Q7S36_03120 [Candidatus Liptonbacteria bacterium]|nr:hypothetical protein [Candidatus Liptonbacteria bacterium]